MKIRYLTAWLAVLMGQAAWAQISINEILAANTQAHPDVVDFEDYPDWIELKNPTGAAVSLDGYFLSDDPAVPLKWPIPAGASIPANGLWLVWADGHDAQPGQVRPRGYWPWRDFTTEGYHANFALSAEGESVVLSKAIGLGTTALISAESPAPLPPLSVATWKYLDNGSNPGTAWRARSFDDSQWSSGPAKLGYGDTQATTVNFGPNASAKYITTYFRHAFEVADPALIAGLSIRLLADDGAVVYLNGVEVVRENMPTGEVNHLTLARLAIGGAEETNYSTYHVPSTGLVAGTNVVAVEVHQNAANSSDLGFDLGLAATTFSSASVIDSVTFGPQIDDVSFGRDPVNAATWVGLATPTPAAPNSGGTVPDLRVPGIPPTVSVPSGFFSTPQSVVLSAASGEIHYTLDGSLPRASSPVYQTPIPVAATTVLRARVFEAGRPPGPVESRTYFFGESPGNVPYVSVVADPESLFGNRIGIYSNQHEPYVAGTTGLRDVYKGKDAPGCLEFFAPGGGSGFRVNGGFRIGGENNWAVNAQRALNFAMRGKYGDDAIGYDLFPGSGIPIHTGLVLREGGDNWGKEMLRDALWGPIASGRMRADTSDSRPSIVFINGVYWGIHNIRARWDDAWFYERKRVNPKDVDHLLYGHVDSQTVSLGIEKGKADDWLDLMSFLSTKDLTVPANYAFVAERVDIDSFIDFIVAESYANNISWVSNREFWRERKPGSKWHWFLPDMDRTFGSPTSNTLSQLLAGEDVLVRLKTNQEFKHRLAQRFAAHVASTFQPSRINAIVDQMAAPVDGEVARHAARWSAQGGMTAASRATNIAAIKSFTAARDLNIHAELQSQLGLSAAVGITLATNHPAAGGFRVCGVPVDSGVVKLFPGIPFDLEVVPAPGYVFLGWSGASGGNPTTVTANAAATITANFALSGETLLGGTLASNTTLPLSGSPYALTEDLLVPPGIALTIDPGVELRMSTGKHLRVQGALIAEGTALQPIHVTGRNGQRWGGISFENPTAPSRLAHVVIRGASRGKAPVLYPAAVSGLNADLELEFVDIDESEWPVFTVGGSTIVRSSRFHCPISGDCINVKRGYAEIHDSIFIGNTFPDTDAIDYDGVAGGIIANNRIYRFRASNSDGIDIGEGCSGLMIEGNLLYYNSDKGISIGQGSTATLRRNLVVGCGLGVGVKDSGSLAIVDQNTFADCGEGVAVYEKNFGHGGGQAVIGNTIFSRCAGAVVTADALSSATVSYSLSDTLAIPGTGNLLAAPGFVDPNILNFQLLPDSPAIDSGDPAHPSDPDGSRVDLGAGYSYSAADYPFIIGEPVVIEEILANSGNLQPDWIELHNRSGSTMDISGWFLSDSAADLLKFRVPAGTILPPGGHVVFWENLHFGQASTDPGRITPFALSDTGETLYLSSATDGQLTDYQTREEFGASMEGESLGNYFKPSTGTYNFVALESPTPGWANSSPRIGPIVISEIHYQPGSGAHADSEYFELQNISSQTVSLFDAAKSAPWMISSGVDYQFPSLDPVVLDPGQRIILTRNLTRFHAAQTVPAGTRVIEWTAGRLANEGEQLQLSRPGGLDDANVRQYIRVDRVVYSPAAPWPVSAAGGGPSLVKIVANAYGNDFANWTAAAANPGGGMPGPSFVDWAEGSGLPPGHRLPADDYDHDGRSNLMEYILGSSPVGADALPPLVASPDGEWMVIDFAFRTDRPGVILHLEESESLVGGSWRRIGTDALGVAGNVQSRQAGFPMAGRSRVFFRLAAEEALP